MINIVEQTINFYMKNLKTPSVQDLEIKDNYFLENRWSVFVTIYSKWEVRWASWNIKEIKANLAEELIENTINAITKDPRFEPLKMDEVKNISIRVDEIKVRQILQDNELKQLDPIKNWILAIKKDYSNMAVILPNINPSLLSWEDFIKILEAKFNIKNFNEKDFILYKIETNKIDNFKTK